VESLQRVLVLHARMLRRARKAIACWSVVGRRFGVAKDIRVLIGKSAWDEVWLWGERRHRVEEIADQLSGKCIAQ
jgi:hypothetical protein